MWPFQSNKVPPLVLTDDNVILISAYPRTRKISISYKKEFRTGKFEDNVLRNMMKGKNFDKNVQSFCGAIAKLLEQLTQ